MPLENLPLVLKGEKYSSNISHHLDYFCFLIFFSINFEIINISSSVWVHVVEHFATAKTKTVLPKLLTE